MKLGLIFLGIAAIFFYFVYAGVRDEVKVELPIEPREQQVFNDPWQPGNSTSTPLPKPSNVVPNPYKSCVAKFEDGECAE